MDIYEGWIEKEYCALAISDNSSEHGWTFKPNFDESKQSAQVEASRKLATLMIDSEISLYAQYLKVT